MRPPVDHIAAPAVSAALRWINSSRCASTSCSAGRCWSSSGTSAARTRSARCLMCAAGTSATRTPAFGSSASTRPGSRRRTTRTRSPPPSSACRSRTRSSSTRSSRSGSCTATSAGPRATCSTSGALLAEYHYGEGGYAETELAIQELLPIADGDVLRPGPARGRARRDARAPDARTCSSRLRRALRGGRRLGGPRRRRHRDRQRPRADRRPPGRLPVDRARAGHAGSLELRIGEGVQCTASASPPASRPNQPPPIDKPPRSNLTGVNCRPMARTITAIQSQDSFGNPRGRSAEQVDQLRAGPRRRRRRQTRRR